EHGMASERVMPKEQTVLAGDVDSKQVAAVEPIEDRLSPAFVRGYSERRGGFVVGDVQLSSESDTVEEVPFEQHRALTAVERGQLAVVRCAEHGDRAGRPSRLRRRLR